MWISIGVFVLFVIGLFSVPVVVLGYYQNDIKAYVLQTLDEQFHGRTTLDGMHISPFVNFPYISIDLENLAFYPDKSDSSQAIYAFEDAYLGFDVFDMLSGRYNVKKLKLKKGYLHLVSNERGELNIMTAKNFGKDSSAAEDTSSIHFDLDSIFLEDFHLTFLNMEGDKFTSIRMKESFAQFDFIDEVMNLKVNMVAVLEEYRTGKTVMFRNKYFELHHDMTYNVEKDFLAIRPGKVILKNGELNFGGNIDFANQGNLDIHFNGEKKNFDLFISLAPDAVVEAMQKFSTRGDIYLKGSITGPSLHRNPHINIELGCVNTFFTDKKSQKDVIKDLKFTGYFNTGDSNTLATSVFYLESLYGAPQNSYLKGMFRVENFEKPLINMDFHADIDLKYLPEFMPVEGLKKSSGKVKIDITLNEFVTADSVLQVASKLHEGTASHIDFNNVSLLLSAYPHPISKINGSISLDADRIRIEEFSAKVLDSDLKFSLTMDDLLHLIHGDNASIDFSLKTDANRLNLGQLVPEKLRPKLDSGLAAIWKDEVYDFHGEIDVKTTTKALEKFSFLPTLAIDFHDLRFKTKLYPNEIKEIRGHIDLNDKYALIKNLVFHVGESKVIGEMKMNPVGPLLSDSIRDWAAIQVDVKSPFFDVKQLLTYNGKCAINDQIEQEIVRNLDFKGHGKLLGNSFGKNGFSSLLDIDRFTCKINKLPVIEKVSGRISTDTLGSIHVQNFKARMGDTELKTSLDLLHFLDGDRKNKNIQGSLNMNKLDVDQLMGYKANMSLTKQAAEAQQPVDHEKAFNVFEIPFPTMQLDLDVQQFKSQKYHIDHVKGRLRSTPNHYAYVDSLHFDAADGHVVIHGYFNGSDPQNIYLNSFIRLKDVDLNKVLYKMDNFGQSFVVSNNLKGILSGTIKSNAHFFSDFTADLRKTTAHIEATITKGRLINFTPLYAMADFMGDKDLDDIHFGELTNTIDVKEGNIHIPAMKLASSIGYMHLSGKQNFDKDMRMDYEIKLPLSLVKQASWNVMKSKLFGWKKQAQAAEAEALPDDAEVVNEEKEIIDGQKGILRKYINVRIEGTSENFKIKMGRKKKGNV